MPGPTFAQTGVNPEILVSLEPLVGLWCQRRPQIPVYSTFHKSHFFTTCAEHLGRSRGASPGDFVPTAPPKSGFWLRWPGVFSTLFPLAPGGNFSPVWLFRSVQVQAIQALLAKQAGAEEATSCWSFSRRVPFSDQLLRKRESTDKYWCRWNRWWASGANDALRSRFTPLSRKVNFPMTSVPANNLSTDSCCTPHKKIWPLLALADFSCLPLRSTLISKDFLPSFSPNLGAPWGRLPGSKSDERISWPFSDQLLRKRE